MPASTADIAAGAPYTGIGTIGEDERTGAVPGHIDSARGISDAASDNDLTRLRDCAPATSSCANFEVTAVQCQDGVDNDSDGYVDGVDYDCWPVLGLGAEDSQHACTDGLDNDGDGYIDAADFDCGPALGL